MKSLKFAETIRIQENAEKVFWFTQDYASRLTWDTFLKKAYLLDNADAAGMGIKAWCVAQNGLGMETVYVSFHPPKVAAIKMTRGPYLFQSFQGSWNFRALSPQETEVTFLYSFTLRWPFSWFGGWMKRHLQANVQQRLLDLKKSLESA